MVDGPVVIPVPFVAVFVASAVVFVPFPNCENDVLHGAWMND